MINKKACILICSIFIISAFLLPSCFLFPQSSVEKIEIPTGQKVDVTISEGMALQQIAELLEQSGIVDNAFLFRLFVQQKQKEKNLIPGTYELVTGSEYEVVLETLTNGPPIVTFNVTIPEGYTVNDIVQKYTNELAFIDSKKMEDAISIDNYDYDYLDGIESLEGFLFPKTYEILLSYSAKDIVDMMLTQYRLETGSLDYSQARENGFTGYDILIIASMIEKEAYIPEERELISAVIHNRLKIGMALGIDATLTYYLGKWDEPLTESDLQIDTAYNTRLYAGLPPTPICNPGLASIIAALNPADANYLFFVVTNSETHEHSFTDDYDEHINNINNAK